MLVTICTIRQLPQAFALADSFRQYATHQSGTVLIGLADDPAHLPTGFVSPYPLLPVNELLSAEQLSALSATYTPTEFVAACKPLLIIEAFRRYPDTVNILYADPNVRLLVPLTPIWNELTSANLVLTPFITRSPGENDTHWPDEKAFQRIGLYSAEFLAFRRSSETDRLLAWWDDRVRQRAYLNFCVGQCMDQTWLMHTPVYFRDVRVIRNPGWHVALWNLSERTLTQVSNQWQVDGPAGQQQSLLFVNFKGLYNPDEGFFPHQNRLKPAQRPDAQALLATYRQSLSGHLNKALAQSLPAYGQQPEPVVLRGWRHATVTSLRSLTKFISTVPLPVIR